jgi:hypothetical protein
VIGRKASARESQPLYITSTIAYAHLTLSVMSVDHPDTDAGTYWIERAKLEPPGALAKWEHRAKRMESERRSADAHLVSVWAQVVRSGHNSKENGYVAAQAQKRLAAASEAHAMARALRAFKSRFEHE